VRRRPRDAREPVVEVGAALRQSFAIALETFEGRELPIAARVWIAAAVELLGSRSRTWDLTSLAQVADCARVADDRDFSRTSEWLNKWSARGALVWSPSRRGESSWVGLPGASSASGDVPLMAPIAGGGGGPRRESRRVQGGTLSLLEGGTLSASAAGLSVPPSEELTEKTSEEGVAGELDKLLGPFDLTTRQREQALQAYEDDRDGLRANVHDVLASPNVRSPEAVLMSKIAAPRRHPRPARRTPVELAEVWVRNVGWTEEEHVVARYLRDEYRLAEVDVGRHVELARDLRRRHDQLGEAATG